MATGYQTEPRGAFFDLRITPDEMELLQNALQLYLKHEQELVKSAEGQQLEGKEGVTAPVDELFIGTYLDAAKLRADLVEISGHDLTEDGV